VGLSPSPTKPYLKASTKVELCSPIEAVLVGILLPVVAWANLEDEVAEVLRRHFNGDVDPLAGHVLARDDASVAPQTA
jgi:hypothetical protein